MSSEKKKKPKFGDAWKDVKSDPTEMDSLFEKFVRSPVRQPVIDPAPAPVKPSPQDTGDQQTLVTQAPVTQQATPAPPAAPAPCSPAPYAAVAPIAAHAPYAGVKGELRIPNTIMDEVLPTLLPPAALTYLRLFRLSHGFRKTTCTIGIPKLANSINFSERAVRYSIKDLESRGLIKRLHASFSGPIKGNTFEIFIPNSPAPPAAPAINAAPASYAANKEDDRLLNTDLHQSETMKIYTSITHNEWRPPDQAAYTKIKDVPLDKIEQGIRLATERAPSRPNSLAYFVKEILNQANPSAPSRAQQKRALEKVVEDVRAVRVGEQGYTFPDFVEDVKRRCARDGVAFDNDLFNEIIG